MQPELSILISACNEKQSFLESTIHSIHDSADISDYEIIICDDGSRVPIAPIEGAQIVRHEKNIGVGAGFMTAAKHAKSENLFIAGADIRYEKNNWMRDILIEVNEHPKAVTCVACVGLNELTENNMKISVRRNVSRRTAATILVYHDKQSHPKKAPDFRNILEAQWLKPIKTLESEEIACVLGAAYGVKKEWLEWTDIWNHHRSWGTLEPCLSLASWLFGGSCRVAPAIEVGHVFSRPGIGENKIKYLLYNKILLATLLFPANDAERLISFLGENNDVTEAKRMIDENRDMIEQKRDEYSNKIVMSIDDYANKFNIDLRR